MHRLFRIVSMLIVSAKRFQVRRALAASIALAFLLESSGSALAADLRSGTAFSGPALMLELSNAIAAVQNTHLGALLSGSESRWEAMHAPPPSPLPRTRPDPPLPSRNVGIRPMSVAPRVSVAPLRAHPTLPSIMNHLFLRRPVPPRAPMKSIPHSGVRNALAVTESVNVANPGTTGINRWWTYEEDAVPGSGRYMVNVANENLIYQDDDMDIPNKGIDLAFRRTYNSQSQHDYANTDGSVPSSYGDGWTNTWDAHIATNSSGGLSVYDIDGARYDYTGSDSAGWTSATPGQYATLTVDQTPGLYDWTKKNGSAYVFYKPSYSTVGEAGRLDEILGRNHNNYIQFAYTFSPDSSSPLNVSTVTATTEAGQKATLTFGNVTYNSVTYRLLSTLTYPDNTTTVTYAYVLGTDLSSATHPSNNSAGIHPVVGYGWNSGHQLNHISSPRYEANSSDGNVDYFYYTGGTNAISQIQYKGVVNPAIGDGMGVPLQSGYSQGLLVYRNVYYAQPSPGIEEIHDPDGHDVKYTYDSIGRVTQTQAWTGSLWLTTTQSWDSNNNLIESTDARGNPSDFGYDGNGNTIWVQTPQVTTSLGAGRPVARYGYDQFNNVIAYCDPQYVWTTGVTTCSAVSGTTHYAWNYSDSSEPYGYLTDAYTPLGYHTAFQYTPASEGGGDYGLPTAAIGDAITQSIDAATPTRTPTKSFTYDPYGDITAYNSGNGTSTATYDLLNRLKSATDADGYTSYTYYFSNGQISKTETPYQHARNVGPTFVYDIDGNETQETVYHGGAYASGGLPVLPSLPPPTNKYYDGGDRLVEVQQPRKPSGAAEAYTNPWITRYLYDLSQGGSAGPGPTINGQAVTAHGNLYKTLELDPPGDVVTFGNTAQSIASTQFHEIKGNAFDAMDRATAKYFFVVNSAHTADALQQETYAYDVANPIATTNSGQLSSDCNGLSQCTYFAYDNDSKLTQSQHTASSSLDRTLIYDPDARTTSVTLPTWGAQTYVYDADGRVIQSAEPTGMSSHATLTYHYYPDGKRSALDVSSSAITQSALFAYAYRADDKLETQQINQPGNSLVGTTTLSFTYSAAGRFKQRTESGPGANPTSTQYVYDPMYGYLTEMDYPAGKLTGIEYDPSGSPLGQNSSVLSQGWTNSLSLRNELLTFTQPSSQDPPPPNNIMANGVAVNTSFQVTKGLNVTSWSASVDPRMGVTLGSDATDTSYTEATQSVTFDTIGRAITDNSHTYPAPSCGNCSEADHTATRTYDQENHVLSTSLSCYGVGACNGVSSASVSYDWGANGHPIRIGATGAYETLHWDGNTLLFTTNNGGALDDVKIGEIGDITPLDTMYKGVSFWDRNLSHEVAYCHNATGGGGNGIPASVSQGKFSGLAHSPCSPSGSGTFPSSMIWVTVGSALNVPRIGSGGLIAMPRGDDFNDGFNIIQGVRIYDSTLGGWATPDAFQGEVHDPVSQKSYVWNRNNAETFSDPSGYSAYAPDEYASFVVDHNAATDDVAYNSHDGQEDPDYLTEVAENATLDAIVNGGGENKIASDMNETFLDSGNNGAKGMQVFIDAAGAVSGHNSVGNSIKIEPIIGENAAGGMGGYKISESIGGGSNSANSNRILYEHNGQIYRAINHGGHYSIVGPFFGNAIPMRHMGAQSWQSLMKSAIEALKHDYRGRGWDTSGSPIPN